MQQTIPRKTGMPKVQYRTGITRSICTVYAQKLDKHLEYRRGLHIDYIDPSYAEEHKKEGINSYYKAYMTLLRVDPLNREKYLYGLVKVYDIFDGGYNYLLSNLFQNP